MASKDTSRTAEALSCVLMAGRARTKAGATQVSLGDEQTWLLASIKIGWFKRQDGTTFFGSAQQGQHT